MSKRPDSDRSNRIETTVAELTSNNNNITNAEIAEKIDTKVSTVRDIRRNQKNTEEDTGDEIGVNADPTTSSNYNVGRLQSEKNSSVY